jgi:peroxiredoxin Q/BCP
MTLDFQAGDQAPDFILPVDTGEEVTLSGLRGRSLVLYFYPKDDTPGCTNEAQQFSALQDDFTKAGAVVIGVSRDSVAQHAKFRKKYGLSITLGADQTGAVTEAYGVWVEKSLYGRQYMGIERATFLIGGDGCIRQIWRKVKVPNHAADVLKALKSA